MAQLLLESWRQALSRLRDDVQQALGRWLPRRQTDGRMAGGGRPPMRWGQSDQQFGTELDNVLDLWSPWWRSLWGEDLRVPSLVSDGGPKIDVEETDDEVIVVAELPGLDKEHFTVEVRGNRLILRGEQRQETEERRRGYYYTERSYGSFARVIALPAEVDAAKAVAKYKNGLLRITLPKTARAKAKRYTVQVQ